MYVSVFDGNSKYVCESRLYLIAVFCVNRLSARHLIICCNNLDVE